MNVHRAGGAALMVALDTPAGFGSPAEWEWSADRFHFHAFFGIDELQMTQAEKLVLTCPAMRQ